MLFTTALGCSPVSIPRIAVGGASGVKPLEFQIEILPVRGRAAARKKSRKTLLKIIGLY
jgi:hypothetical protein